MKESKTVTIEIGEWVNSITTNQEGTFIEIDKDLLREVVDMLEEKCCE